MFGIEIERYLHRKQRRPHSQTKRPEPVGQGTCMRDRGTGDSHGREAERQGTAMEERQRVRGQPCKRGRETMEERQRDRGQPWKRGRETGDCHGRERDGPSYVSEARSCRLSSLRCAGSTPSPIRLHLDPRDQTDCSSSSSSGLACRPGAAGDAGWVQRVLNFKGG